MTPVTKKRETFEQEWLDYCLSLVGLPTVVTLWYLRQWLVRSDVATPIETRLVQVQGYVQRLVAKGIITLQDPGASLSWQLVHGVIIHQ